MPQVPGRGIGRVGSVLQTSTGTRVAVTAIKKRVEIKRVHNLTVDDIHTYYVVSQSASVLVHNTNETCEVIYKAPGKGTTDKLLNDGFDAADFPGAATDFRTGAPTSVSTTQVVRSRSTMQAGAADSKCLRR